mgnify:CR=1 FL=1
MTTHELIPGQVSIEQLAPLSQPGQPVRLHRDCRPAVEAAARCIAAAAAGEMPIYGVNTGFGKLASVRIAPADLSTLQRNLILSHCAGVGDPAEPAVVRLMMTLKLLSLGRGASGVRWALIECLEQMLAADLLPVVPSQGSVGASGDLAPLAHMAAAMIGEGSVTLAGALIGRASCRERVFRTV